MRLALQSRSLADRCSLREKARTSVLAVALFLLGTPLARAAIPPAEHNALVDLYNSTNGANWTDKSGWLTGDECTWHGVTCDAEHTSVEQIVFWSNNLAGTLPASLGNLTKLQFLQLQFNHLSGGIPPELGSLTNLQKLALDQNHLSGTIPSQLGNLSALRWLTLGSNSLSGSIPADLGKLTNLQFLALFGNQLGGSIPPLGKLTSLQSLELQYNQLSGSIPPELGSLSSLQTLWLHHNSLSGRIPAQLANLRGLTDIRLDYNQLSGSLPPELGNLPSLEVLKVDSNQLSGAIPAQLGNSISLEALILSNNQLSGSIPAQLGNLVKLQGLFLQGNQLSGSIPSALASLTGLSNGGLDIRYNALYSTDPALTSFLNARQTGEDWQGTQTIAPANLSTSGATANAMTVNWTPIAYAAGGGFYQVWYSTTAGGPYTPFATTTSSKSSFSATVTGLAANTRYYFVVSTTTQPNSNNANTVTSGFSGEVSGLTAAVLEPAVSVASFPTGMVASLSSGGATDTYTLINTGGAPTMVSLTQSGSFFTQSPTSFTLQPGATQRIELSSVAQPAGVYDGASIPSGTGVPSGLTVPVRLLSAAPPTGTVRASAAESRTDVSADVGTNPSGMVEFTNSGSATLQGILVSDSPWLIPQAGLITIGPGQTVTVGFTIDRSKRPDSGAVGSITGKLSLVYFSGTAPGVFADRTGPTGGSTQTGQVSVTIVDLARPPVGPATIPPFGLGEFALLVGGLPHGNGIKGDLAVVNSGMPTSLNDLKLYYVSASSASQASTMGQLAPNVPVRLSDIVKSVFGRDGETGGVMLRGTSIDRVSLSAIRLNTSNPNGTYMSALPVFRSDRGMAAGDSVFLAGLKKESGLHTNVCLQEGAGAAGSVTIDFLDAQGTTVGTRASVPLSAFGFLEIADAAPSGAAAARITSLGPSQSRIVAYGLAIDEGTGDSWCLVDWGSLHGASTTDASVLALAGSNVGAKAQTDLALVNKTSTANLVTLKYTPNCISRQRVVRVSGLPTPEAVNEQTQTITLGPLNSTTISDLLATKFAMPSDSIGYLTITPAAGIAITARTSVVSSAQSGTSGTGIVAVPMSSALAASQSKSFAGIEDASPASVASATPATYRANLGLIETAGQSATVRVTMRYHFPAGQLTSGYAESSKDFTLTPRQFLLLPNAATAVIGNARKSFGDLHDVQVEVLVTGGKGKILPFVECIDNGSGDTILRMD